MLNGTKYLMQTGRRWLVPATSRFNYSSQTKKQESSVTENIRASDSGVLRSHKKKPKREPLVKGFFVGKVDKDLLAYPEVVLDEDLVALYKNTNSYRNFLDEQIVSSDSDFNSKVEALKAGDSFGFDVSQSYGGRGYLSTETMFGNEAEAENLSFCNLLNNHRSVTQMITDQGTDNQKLKYLPKLASGELIGTVGFFESTPADKKAFNFRAKFSDKDNSWTLKGEKAFVVNAQSSSLFLVFAATESIDHIGDYKDCISAFLIEGDTPGISFLDADKTFSSTEVSQRKVQFDVVIPDTNLVGSIDGGLSVGMKFLRQARINTGIMSLSLSKKIINQFIEYNINGPQKGNLKDQDYQQDRLGRMTCDIYAMESMLYFTSGLHDTYEGQETDVESAIIKAFCVDSILSQSTIPLNSFGPGSLLAGENSEQNLRDVLHLATLGETMDAAKLFIGLTGIQHAGMNLHAEVKKIRNPLSHPGLAFKKIFKQSVIDHPKQTLNLQYNVHPTMDPSAQWLEYSILRLEAATEILLGRHGQEIINNKIEILRLADAATLCYAMFATIARASRAYCIGLKHSDYEMLIASAFCLNSSEKVKLICQEIDKGEFLTNDNNHRKIAKQLLKSKQYFSEHPITRNF